MPAQYHVIPSGSIQCNCVIVWDDGSRQAIIIDPTDNARLPLQWVAEQELTVSQILLTHGHFDHAADAERAAAELGVPLRMHPADISLYRHVAQQAMRFGAQAIPPEHDPQPLTEGESIQLSDELSLQVLHVPGHSPGGVAFYLEQGPYLFAGDTLFAGSVGRTDLPGGSRADLAQSIRSKLYQLPDACVVIPGHGPPTTIGNEKRANAFVRAQ